MVRWWNPTPNYQDSEIQLFFSGEKFHCVPWHPTFPLLAPPALCSVLHRNSVRQPLHPDDVNEATAVQNENGWETSIYAGNIRTWNTWLVFWCFFFWWHSPWLWKQVKDAAFCQIENAWPALFSNNSILHPGLTQSRPWPASSNPPSRLIMAVDILQQTKPTSDGCVNLGK